MEYTKQLIAKAKGSRCKICHEYITEAEADGQEFQAAKTNRGGTHLYIPGVGRKSVSMEVNLSTIPSRRSPGR